MRGRLAGVTEQEKPEPSETVLVRPIDARPDDAEIEECIAHRPEPIPDTG